MPLFARINGRRKRKSLAKPPEVCRITVLGSCQVGKTSLIRQFLEFQFSQKYRPTVDDIIQLNYDSSEGKSYELEIIDATGSCDFPAMRKLYIDTSDAFIIVMSVDLPESVEEARQILRLIQNRRNSTISLPGTPLAPPLTSALSVQRRSTVQEHEGPRIVFVINKMDLKDEDRKLDVESVQYDDDFGFENVVLVSAKENWNVDEAFSRLVDRRESVAPSDPDQVEKSLEAALQHRRNTAPMINVAGNDKFLMALKNSIAIPPSRKDNYIPIGP